MTHPSRLIIGMTGASGSLYGVQLLKRLHPLGIETHLIVTPPGYITLHHETGLTLHDLQHLAHTVHDCKNITASCASGSFRTLGMIVAPCSVKTLAELALGLGSSLLTRSADVTLKERRRLVLMVRETPLSALHLQNMLTLSNAGGVIMPPVPAFYTHPRTIEALVNDTVDRVLSLFGFEEGQEWTGLPSKRSMKREDEALKSHNTPATSPARKPS